MFVILQDHRARLSYAPQSWIKVGPDGREIIYWPKKNLSILQNDAQSTPVLKGIDKWVIINEVVKRRNILTKEAAERVIDEMTRQSNTEGDDENEFEIMHRPKTKGSLKQINNTVLTPKFEFNLPRTPLSSVVPKKIISSPITPKTPLSSIPFHKLESPQQVEKIINCNIDELPSFLLNKSPDVDFSDVRDDSVPKVTNNVLIRTNDASPETLFINTVGQLVDQYGNVRGSGEFNPQNYDNMNNDSSSAANAEVNGDVRIADLLITILNNQKINTKKLISMEKGMQEMFAQLQNIAASVSSLPNQLIAQSTQPNSLDPTEVIDFNKIYDEISLTEFEEKIQDGTYRKKLLDYFSSRIGICKNVSLRSAALLLDQKIFEESFWSTTAWTGGRKLTGPKKFPFANHIKIILFMNEVLRKVCGLQMSDSEFADFIKSRTRNGCYMRRTKRQPSARLNRKKNILHSDDPIMEPLETHIQPFNMEQ